MNDGAVHGDGDLYHSRLVLKPTIIFVHTYTFFHTSTLINCRGTGVDRRCLVVGMTIYENRRIEITTTTG